MEQSPSHQVILDWLTDYTHFICDRFAVPHNQVDGLLEQYFAVAAVGPSQQPTAPAFAQPDAFPEMPNPQYDANAQEQVPCASVSTDLQEPPRGYPAPSGRSGEAPLGERADDSSDAGALRGPNARSSRRFSSHDQQSDHTMTMDSDFLDIDAQSPQSTRPSDKTTVGSIADYDPHWIQRENLNPTTVDDFKSAMKFEALFHQGVIRTGDTLAFHVSVSSDGQPEETTAHLQITDRSGRGLGRGTFPDLSVTVLGDPTLRFPVAKGCKGTTAMVEHLKSKCDLTVLRSGWRDIRVLRGPQDLGSLWWVKQAFHIWRDRKDREARGMGQSFRPRRPQRVKGSPEGVVQYKGSFGVWRDGAFVEDADQERYRPGG